MDAETYHRILFFSLILLFAASPVSAAQADNSSTNETALITFDDSTKILSANWDKNGVTMVIESDIPRIATVTDVNSMPGSGAGKVNYKKVRLANGKTEIRMDATNDRGSMTVTVAVAGSVVALSNPAKPLFSNITRFDFYIEAILVAIFVPIQYIFRDKAFKMRLRRGLSRVI